MIFHGENNTKHDEEMYDDCHQYQNNMYMRFNLNNVNNVNEITVQFSNMATTNPDAMERTPVSSCDKTDFKIMHVIQTAPSCISPIEKCFVGRTNSDDTIVKNTTKLECKFRIPRVV